MAHSAGEQDEFAGHVFVALFARSRQEHADFTAEGNPPVAQDVTGNAIRLRPFAVRMTTLPE
jgi:hypothetical protein